MNVWARRIDAWCWWIIFGGLALAGFGLAVRRSDPDLGAWILLAGITALVAGALLVWWRSRLPDDGGASS